MITFYYHPSPNPAKVALFLEESGLEYETVPVDTRKGDQHSQRRERCRRRRNAALGYSH